MGGRGADDLSVSDDGSHGFRAEIAGDLEIGTCEETILGTEKKSQKDKPKI